MKHNCTNKIENSVQLITIEPIENIDDLPIESRENLPTESIDNLSTEIINDLGETVNASNLGVTPVKDVIPRGFVNPGTNTCYLNSVLQSLFHNQSLVKWLIEFEQLHSKTCEYRCKFIISFPFCYFVLIKTMVLCFYSLLRWGNERLYQLCYGKNFARCTE